jgi:hypothetical protein
MAPAWRLYVDAAEGRMTRELSSAGRFLGMDFDEDGADERRAVLGGGIVIRRLQARSADGRSVNVPSASVNHWRGTVFIRGAVVRDLVDELQRTAPPAGQDDILQSRLLEHAPDRIKVFLKLQRRKIVTVVYNTEHDVTFRSYGPTRAPSRSTATTVAELQDPGTPSERERAPGEDRGFLWRLNAYWRYEQAADGVIAECESISLSRDVPALVRYLVDPLVERTARESMERTLASFRGRFEPASGRALSPKPAGRTQPAQ